MLCFYLIFKLRMFFALPCAYIKDERTTELRYVSLLSDKRVSASSSLSRCPIRWQLCVMDRGSHLVHNLLLSSRFLHQHRNSVSDDGDAMV